MRRVLIPEGRFGRYFFYAIGEIVLVVIGILIALQINNWNEDKKKNQRRVQLIQILIQDFETSRTRLKETINLTDSVYKATLLFLTYTQRTDTLISNETLHYLIGHGWKKIEFKPALAAYESALNTGDIGLLNSRALNKAFSEFIHANKDYFNHLAFGGDIVFTGSLWELRKHTGSITLFEEKYSKDLIAMYGFTESEYQTLLKGKLVRAAIENMNVVYENIYEALTELDESAKAIISELKKLQSTN